MSKPMRNFACAICGKSGQLPEGAIHECFPYGPTLATLRTAREGLLAAAAVVEKRSPAFKLIEAGLDAVNGALK